MTLCDDRNKLGRILVLRPGNSGEAIHVLPDIGGSLLYARQLIPHFGSERPILGLPLPPLGAKALAVETMESLAEYNARVLEDAAPGQRHHLLGHSFAGFLAYETARALHRIGARTGLVAILDVGVPPRGIGRAAVHAQDIVRRGARTLLGRGNPVASEDVLTAPGYVTFDLRRHPVPYRHVISSLYGAMVRYCPDEYPGSVMLFRSEAQGRWGRRDLGWARLAKGGVVTIEVEGDHLAMVRRSECARRVALSIEGALRDAEARAAF